MMDEGAEPQGRSGSHTRGKTGFVSRLLLPPSDSLYTAWLDSFRPTQICSLLLREAGLLSTDSPLSLKDREAWRAAVHGVTRSRTQLSDWTTTLSYLWVWLLQSPGEKSNGRRRWWLEHLSFSSLSECSHQDSSNPGPKVTIPFKFMTLPGTVVMAPFPCQVRAKRSNDSSFSICSPCIL